MSTIVVHKHPSVRKPAHVSIGLFAFVMITSAVLLSIRTFPVEGLLGWQSVAFNIAAILMYLVPAAFVAAELASGWPGEGGVYEWVKDAFGERFGDRFVELLITLEGRRSSCRFRCGKSRTGAATNSYFAVLRIC